MREWGRCSCRQPMNMSAVAPSAYAVRNSPPFKNRLLRFAQQPQLLHRPSSLPSNGGSFFAPSSGCMLGRILVPHPLFGQSVFSRMGLVPSRRSVSERLQNADGVSRAGGGKVERVRDDSRRFWTSGSIDKNKGLVEHLQQYGVIKSKKVAEVMETIDRGLFVPPGIPAYVDSPQPIGYNATISAPHMHATCLGLLENNLQPGMRALDVGSAENKEGLDTKPNLDILEPGMKIEALDMHGIMGPG
ncbi:Protein-L-isoaspartate O-methyltransferase 2 [Asimina triloba]